MKKIVSALTTLFGLLCILPQTSHSIPAFARKYGFNCNMCHVSFTKLNDFGQRYRDNGYQIPGQEGTEKNVFEIAPPLSIRTTSGLGLSHQKQDNVSDPAINGTTSGFNIYGFDLLAAGVIHKNLSFLMIYTPRIDEPAADYTGPGDNGSNPSQTAALESANLIFSNLIKDKLSLRFGKFEPAYHDISSKRSYYIIQPYEVYTFTGESNNPFVFDDNQLGIEVTGHFPIGFHYGAGVVNGNGANPDNNKHKDVYATVHQIFGRGEGQSAGQRVGAFGYLGWQPASIANNFVSPTGETDGAHNRMFYRIGADVGLNFSTLNIRGLIMHGVDDSVFNVTKPSEKYKFTGGFAEVDFLRALNNRMLISGLFNWVSPPSYDSAHKVIAVSGLVKYYLGDWTAVNVALHGEYTHRQTGKGNVIKEDRFALLLDFDF